MRCSAPKAIGVHHPRRFPLGCLGRPGRLVGKAGHQCAADERGRQRPDC
ncbi:MAG: hypothetical protein Ct9H300mP1_20490 [Planctomycetaceae bacterium]|nr:MAG: hypothetical protein Ct9H300mP1_20490 [Planctomycetaceae bacterium]